MSNAYVPPPLGSALEGVSWPAFPGAVATTLMAQLFQLEQSQWWPPELLLERQLEQFALLAQHARTHSDFYHARFASAGLATTSRFSLDDLRALPLLTRTELLTEGARIDCRTVPVGHGPLKVARTSGSTGQIVEIRRSELNQILWLALNMRDHLWHRRDFTQSLAAIRPHRVPLPDGTSAFEASSWGLPASLLYRTGPGFSRSSTTDVAELAAWLGEVDPAYLLVLPTVLRGLLTRFESGARIPSKLREVRTIGETVSADLRERCHRVLGVPLIDSYSSNEVGAIGLQCPDSDLYHIHVESLIVEVLDDSGCPCPPGQVGRVVVTDLHNFATPLIRYELRDHAEVGLPCKCGRGLPTLARILGRERNMVVLPSGQRYWPQVGVFKFREIAPILQYQVIQHDLHGVEMRLVVQGGRPTREQEAQLADLVRKSLGFGFAVRFTYFEKELPHTSSGKFEEFMCLAQLPPGASSTPDEPPAMPSTP